MGAAVLLMPVALVLKSTHENVTVAILLLSMVLELIGLTFVIVQIIKRRKV